MSEATSHDILQGRLGDRLVVIALAVSFLLLVFNRLVFWIYHPLFVWTDQSVYLETAEMILRGKVPYLDVFDFNPPLIMYLNVVPVMVAKLLRVTDALGLSLSVILLNAFSCMAAAWLVYRNRHICRPLPLVALIFFFALYGQGLDTDMGQREHLFMLLYLPFFVGRGLVWTGGALRRGEAVAIGILAGLGLALKPHFVLCALLAELGFFFQFRRPALFLRPENYAVLGVFLAYLLGFFLLPQAARDIFLYQAIPVYAWGNLWSAKCLIHMICSAMYGLQPFINFISAMLLAFVLRRHSAWILPLALFTCGAFFNYFQGGQSWTYRMLPMAYGAFMLYGIELGLVLQYLLQRFEQWLFLRQLLAIALLLGLSAGSYFSVRETLDQARDNDRFDLTQLQLGYLGSNARGYLSPLFFCIVEHTRPNDYVLHLGTPIEPGFPAILQSGRRPASRYLYCFLVWLEFAREKSASPVFEELEELVVANYGADIARNRPVLIMVQDMPMEYILARFNFFEKYMQGYKKIGKTAEHSIYKYTGNMEVFADAGTSLREKLVISVLAGERTVDQVAIENDLDRDQVEGWVKKARLGLVDAVTERVADRKQELYDENKRLTEQIYRLNEQAADLRLQIESLQKGRDILQPKR
ncbi:MAG: hypothetical protein JSS83_20685 [Cyanobacteria bacterium SZAS LIN-3]|nr:hypothetical protein [Cyanobacteria bacterium SZAS LIN-3]